MLGPRANPGGSDAPMAPAPSHDEPGATLKVLHVAPSLDQGGAERVLHGLANAGGGVSHRIVVMQDRIFFDFAGHDVAELGFDLSSHTRSLARLAPALRRLRALLRAERPDVVQGWLYYGNLLTLAAAGLGTPVVWSIHNTTLASWRAKPVLRAADRALALGSRWLPDRIVYCAQSARALHEAHGYRADIGLVIANGVSGAEFRRDPERRVATRARLGLAGDDIAVGLVGRYDPQKDIPTSLRAFAGFAGRRPGARLVLAGRGMDAGNGELRGLAAAAGLADKVLPLGAVADVGALIAAMDMVMLGSRYGEALPMTLLEALFCEVPVVATRGGDVALLPIPDHALAAPGDAAGLGAALERVWSGPAADWDAGFASVRRDYSLERSAAAYADLYRRLASGAGARGAGGRR